MPTVGKIGAHRVDFDELSQWLVTSCTDATRSQAVAMGMPSRSEMNEQTAGLHLRLTDETGVVQVIVWKSLREQHRPEALRSRLLAVYDTWHRDGDATSLIAVRLMDLTPPLIQMATSSRDFHQAARLLGREASR